MQIHENYPLSNLTSFRIGGDCLYMIEAATEEELLEAIRFARDKKLPTLILGAGSNLLVSDNGFPGVVIRNLIVSKELIPQTEGEVLIKAGAGYNWDELVASAVAAGLWGIENLSNIPSSTGAIPVQNVGAYGQEASQVVHSVETIDLKNLTKETFSNLGCGFGYRSSKFNTDLKNKYAITSVTFKLSTLGQPNLAYADVKKYFDEHPEIEPTLENIRAAIIEIRRNKFPDLSELGNAGSFFKNSILSEKQYEDLVVHIKKNFDSEIVKRLEEIKNKFRQETGIKIPAAFLIDICGLKGKQIGAAKLWDRQPLVIVNMGSATSADVLALYQFVKQTVLAKTGLELQSEPEFIGF